MIWAYAIAAHEPRGQGLDGAPLECAGGPALHAIVSRHEALERGDMRAHAEVVERLMEDGPVLPLRYGTLLETPDPLLRTLAERGDEFAAALDRVRGCVEMAVSVPAEDAEPERPAAGGREYLMAKVERRRRAARRASELSQTLAPLARDRRERLDPGDGFAVKVAYLVESAAAPEFERRAQQLDGAVCTGPWPPYSFAA